MKWTLALLALCAALVPVQLGKSGKCANDKLTDLARQIMMTQFYIEEQTRSNGHSGIKTMRLRSEGTRPYHAATNSDLYTNDAIHDHPDFFNTCGMGEVLAVLNGVEFKTRHNDYLLVMKERCGHMQDFTETRNIEYPDVPDSVTDCSCLKDQVMEMRKYFKAWQDQDCSHRDYKKYFKANLCYLEGAWTESKQDDIQEAFFNERHRYEAHTWEELFANTKFSSETGIKENEENFAYMPYTIRDVRPDGTTVMGQWNYRILCHPVDCDLPIGRLHPVDDLRARMTLGSDFKQYKKNRNARFSLNPLDRDLWCDQPTKHGLLDKLMEQIPGYDGYGAFLKDEGLGNGYNHKAFTASDHTTCPLNAAYYHRWYQNNVIGAMGSKNRHRGLNDENLFMAMTTNPKIVPTRVEFCPIDMPYPDACESFEQRWTYAIPMEIVYTTPLHNWNPYNIAHKGFEETPCGQTVYEGPHDELRDGANDHCRAFNGTNSATFYRLPTKFFSEPAPEVGEDPADTPADYKYVLDCDGKIRKVRAAGIHVFLPNIPGVGIVRTRYPVNPVHGEGSAVWKELSALSDIVMNPSKFKYMVRDDYCDDCGPPGIFRLVTSPASSYFGGHVHEVMLSGYEYKELQDKGCLYKESEMRMNHTHNFKIVKDGDDYKYSSCDGHCHCHDGHGTAFTVPEGL